MGFVLLGCYTELLDEQYRTACRRLPADVAAADPDIFRRRGLTETSSPAPVFGVSQATVSRRWDLLRPLIGDALADVVPDPLEVVGRGTVLVGGTVCPTWDWRHVPGSAAEPRSGLQDRCKPAAQTCFKKVLLVPHWSLHGQHAHHGSRLAPGGHAARPRRA